MQRRMRRGLQAKWEWLSRSDALKLWEPLVGRRLLVLLGPMIANMHHQLAAGGPSGDFVQWADLLSIMSLTQCALHLVTDSASVMTLSLHDITQAELLIMDYNSLWVFHRRVKQLSVGGDEVTLWRQLLPRIRVIDFFGSEEWSRAAWFHGKDADLHQVWTAFPYLPNNTFLGFAVMPLSSDQPLPDPSPLPALVTKKEQMMLWGKDSRYFTDNSPSNPLSHVSRYLRAIRHAVGNATTLLTSVSQAAVTPALQAVNARSVGPTSALNFTTLVQHSRALIGVGAPLDGISWLEAIAEGTPFINPSMASPFIPHDKPHHRLYHSQVQYAEMLTEPYVYNLRHDMDEVELTAMFERLGRHQTPPYIFPDFRVGAFSERVVRLLRYQTFNEVSDLTLSGEASQCMCPYCLTCPFAHRCVC